MAPPLKLAPDLVARIERLAEARQQSAHGVMREAILAYADQQERRGAQDRIVFRAPAPDPAPAPPAAAPAKRKRRLAQPPLKSWSQAVTIVADPYPDPQREQAWQRFRSQARLGAALSSVRPKDDTATDLRWHRDDD